MQKRDRTIPILLLILAAAIRIAQAPLDGQNMQMPVGVSILTGVVEAALTIGLAVPALFVAGRVLGRDFLQPPFGFRAISCVLIAWAAGAFLLCLTRYGIAPAGAVVKPMAELDKSAFSNWVAIVEAISVMVVVYLLGFRILLRLSGRRAIVAAAIMCVFQAPCLFAVVGVVQMTSAASAGGS